MNRQRFSMYLGLVIVASHILLTFYLMFWFGSFKDVEIQKISLPLTVSYVSAIVLWFFQHDALIVSDKPIRGPLVVLVILVVGAMIFGLFAIPIEFLNSHHPDAAVLNERFATLEAAFGGAFGIIMSFLFDYSRTEEDAGS